MTSVRIECSCTQYSRRTTGVQAAAGRVVNFGEKMRNFPFAACRIKWRFPFACDREASKFPQPTTATIQPSSRLRCLRFCAVGDKWHTLLLPNGQTRFTDVVVCAIHMSIASKACLHSRALHVPNNACSAPYPSSVLKIWLLAGSWKGYATLTEDRQSLKIAPLSAHPRIVFRHRAKDPKSHVIQSLRESLSARAIERSDYHQADRHVLSQQRPVQMDKEFLLSLVDLYYTGENATEDKTQTQGSSPSMTPFGPPNETGEDSSHGLSLQLKAEVSRLNSDLRQAISSEMQNEHLFKLYQALPAPRARYIPKGLLRRFVYQLSLAPRGNTSSTKMFLSVVDDMNKSKIPLQLGEWNTAISFAGRSVTRLSGEDVKDALQLWKSMELEYGIPGNEVTFNILYDIASRAKKFALAEMIHAEMKKRSLPSTRFSLVSRIQNYGFKGDGDGVRRTYVDLVSNGEVVDLWVLNAVMAALLRCGETSAAENIYQRMRRLGDLPATADGSNNIGAEPEATGKYLRKAANMSRDDPDLLASFQGDVSFKPNLVTFQVLLLHHCCVSGELSRVAAMIQDMRHCGYPLSGFVFLYIFKGFHKFGGMRYTPWSQQVLSDVWEAFLKAVDNDNSSVTIGRWIVVWALRAFSRVSGKSGANRVWKDVKERARFSEGEIHTIERVLHNYLAMDR